MEHWRRYLVVAVCALAAGIGIGISLKPHEPAARPPSLAPSPSVVPRLSPELTRLQLMRAMLAPGIEVVAEDTESQWLTLKDAQGTTYAGFAVAHNSPDLPFPTECSPSAMTVPRDWFCTIEKLQDGTRLHMFQERWNEGGSMNRNVYLVRPDGTLAHAIAGTAPGFTIGGGTRGERPVPVLTLDQLKAMAIALLAHG